MPERVFISHATTDKATALALREKFALWGLDAWVDSRELVAGMLLSKEIKRAIESSAYFVAVLGPKTVNSKWVTREVRHALKLQKKNNGSPRVIPVILDGLEFAALHHWFGDEPLGTRIELKPGGLDSAMPALLAALGLQAPVASAPQNARPLPTPARSPTADLVLTLIDPAITTGARDVRRASATATLTYAPPGTDAPTVGSPRFAFTAPLGPIETENMAWYLERYAMLPTATFREKARDVETALPEWGRALRDAALVPIARAVFEAWKQAPSGSHLRFVVQVDKSLMEGSSPERQAEAAEAASLLLSLPWELLHDESGYLFQGTRGVRVCRRLPNTVSKSAADMTPPLRVLLLSPRPSDEGYIDHRITARPVVEALSRLGDLASFTLLTTPTFAAMEAELRRANEAGTPYHVVHFDGHGVYDPSEGLGALCFEQPGADLMTRPHDLVNATKLADALRGHRVPLFFLEACQSAQSRTDPTGSVAAKLLEGGVASVAAMSHSVLVETARRFVTEFYAELVRGRTTAQAMLAGQRALFMDPRRGRTFAGELTLQDWFVPVLYQEAGDPTLVRGVPDEQVQAYLRKQHKLALGDLPDPPMHGFVGRSVELLAAERILEKQSAVLIRGEGGEGKTAMASELALWQVTSRRADRTAFVPFDQIPDAKTAVANLIAQLAPGEASKAATGDKEARHILIRALEERRCVIVLDNLESVLLGETGTPPTRAEVDIAEGVRTLIKLLIGAGATRLILTSREGIGGIDDLQAIGLGRLSMPDATALVAGVLGAGVRMPGAADAVQSDAQIEELVEAVGGHARALVLLTNAAKEQGVSNAAGRLRELARDLETKHPGMRERSLIASVTLSLDRLTPATRTRIGPLAAVHDGVSLTAIAALLALDEAGVQSVASELVGVGLATLVENVYLRLDPALVMVLADELEQNALDAARVHWSNVMCGLAAFLNKQRITDVSWAMQLARLEMFNLVAASEFIAGRESPATVIHIANIVADFARGLSLAKSLTRTTKVREDTARKLPTWSHAAFSAADAALDRLIDERRMREAVVAANHLLERCRAGGESAFPEARYDTAMAHFNLGRALRLSGAAAQALEELGKAHERFESLATTDSFGAGRMALASRSETADCLRSLGRLDESAALYETTIAQFKARNDTRSAAVGKGQLATVRMLQHRNDEAVRLHIEAKSLFESLPEPEMVAVAWHQIAMVHNNAKNYPAAEKAYLESLKIRLQRGDRGGEAATLSELGNLHVFTNRPEEAVTFFARAADIFAQLDNRFGEGSARNNAAVVLIRQRRFPEARHELIRTMECKQNLGHAAQPWTTFMIMYDLENAEGNPAAAAQARAQAIDAYLAYRRDGGQNLSGGAVVFEMVASAINQGLQTQSLQRLDQLLKMPDSPAYLKPLIPALKRVLAGELDPALAADPSLDYDDAVELRLLIEELANGTTTSQ